jgi:parallel beta-helix repeat protein
LFPGNKTVEISAPITVFSNITLRASHSKATIRITVGYNGGTITSSTPMIIINNRENIAFENIIFDGDDRVNALVNFSTTTVNHLSIINCEFQNIQNDTRGAAGIALGDATDILIKGCTFRNSNFGIRFEKRNSRIRIEDNTFENTLNKNPIRIQGVRDINNPSLTAYSSDVWITGNKINIGRADSIIEELSMYLPRDPNTGAVNIGAVDSDLDPGNATYEEWRAGRFGPSAIYLTCGADQAPETLPVDNHINVVIENNFAEGPDYGFFDGGSADLYSIKDVVNLKLLNNTGRNSGDLGISVERSFNAIVSNNTIERNNSSGIAFTNVKNAVISNNIVANNALRRDFIYNNVPYGGILLLGTTTNTLIEGNQLYCYPSVDISFAINITEGVDYTRARTNASSYYGIMIRQEGAEDVGGSTSVGTPSRTKIGINQYSGHRWGPIFNESTSTQITESFTATAYPTDEDVPVGTWVSNSNLIFSSLGSNLYTHFYLL